MKITRVLLSSLALLLLAACTAPSLSDSDRREITIIYTNDEHGWMEGMEPGQGAANIYSLWQQREGYTEDGPFLILSGGDNWTGPAISTWTEGESMVEVMNAMNYDASAVGNHEFDFGLDAIRERSDQADYPYLSANTRWLENGNTPEELGILPFTIKTVDDVRFGIIGLTTLDTPTAANPAYVSDLIFLEYEQALRETIPVVNSQNPDVLIVIAHVCVNELERLIRRTQDLGIAMMGAGHCNELVARRIGNTVLLGGGFHFTSYATARFEFEQDSNILLRTRFNAYEYNNEAVDSDVAAIIASWADEMSTILTEEVAHFSNPLRRSSETLEQLIVDSWLEFDPTADVAITNAGGIRIDLPAGRIDVNTIVSLLPFDNTIIAAEVSGRTLMRALNEGGRPIVGGLERRLGSWFVKSTNQRLQDEETYRVLLNSFMFAGGDDFGAIAEEDPDAFDTGVNYRQPFIDWLQAQDSSAENPLRF